MYLPSSERASERSPSRVNTHVEQAIPCSMNRRPSTDLLWLLCKGRMIFSINGFLCPGASICIRLEMLAFVAATLLLPCKREGWVVLTGRVTVVPRNR